MLLAAALVTLVLPQPLHAGQAVWLECRLGVVLPGRRVEVTTASGHLLGAISPHGIRHGQAAGTYTLPVPPAEIAEGRLTVRAPCAHVRLIVR
ncbi:MAG TPA: hypothetical protein VG387_00925 [Rhizomicrobium sp.]|jgi:hypothetical protein|nr:hypothetical protein [Rhizomicrobium sp.]